MLVLIFSLLNSTPKPVFDNTLRAGVQLRLHSCRQVLIVINDNTCILVWDHGEYIIDIDRFQWMGNLSESWHLI